MSKTDIGIDLGTANTVITLGKKGVVLSEPSAIAYHTHTKEVLAVGKRAYQMIGKTPDYIEVIRPLSGGVISDDRMTQYMIREFILQVTGQAPHHHLCAVLYHRRGKACCRGSCHECRLPKGIPDR